MELHNHEVERALLGALSNVGTMDAAKAVSMLRSSHLTHEDMHHPRHKALFKACHDVLIAGDALTPLSVKAELERGPGLPAAGGWEYLTKVLLDPTFDSHGFESHAKVVKDLALRRSVLSELADLKASIMDGKMSPTEAASQFTGRLASFAVADGSIKTLRDTAQELVNHLDDINNGKVDPILPTGIRALDAVIGGLQPTLTLVGALPGVGKSALIATMAQSLARRGKRVGVISLEDDAQWLGWRLLSDESRVDQFVLRFRKLTDQAFQQAVDGFGRMHLYADRLFLVDGSDYGMNIEQVIQSCNALVALHKCEAIIVDHLGEISGAGDEARYDMEVSRNLSKLRGVANRFGVPMVVAAHFRRREGLGPGDMPRLSDFANSSGAERKARVALGLSREPDSDTMTIHVLKNTNGKAGRSVEVRFQGAAAMLKATEGMP